MAEALSEARTLNYMRQIGGSVIYRVIAMVASFFAIPLTIRYLGKEEFGVWSTLLTTMSWLVFFDFGIGNGLRNKVAESLAKNERSLARRYIASGYTLIGLIALVVWALVSIGSYYISWQFVFNTQAISEKILRHTIQIVVFFIALNFWVGLITSLLGAIQKTSFVAFGQLISNMLVLSLVYVLSKKAEASPMYLAFAYGFSLVFSNILLSLLFFRNNLDLKPTLNLDNKHIRPLINFGMHFFVIQLAVLVIYATDKVLISHLFGPKYVADYEVVFKIFSIITFMHGIISAPLWSAYTDAYFKRDMEWIKITLHRQLFFFGALVVVIIFLILTAQSIVKFLLGDDVLISQSLIWVMGLFVAISAWNNVYATVVNGIGSVKIQLYTAMIAMIVNVPLSIFIVKISGIGVAGVVLGTISSLSFASVILPLQVHFKILSYSSSKNVR
jgi:O-antigen/teichoic acid export membrane protein